MLISQPYAALLGTIVKLPVVRFGPPGAFLSADPADKDPRVPVILLPALEVPENTREGDELEVFITLDSEDRPLATVYLPKALLGEVAFMRVTALTEFGAFVDWGLPKELLVPHKEQTRDLFVGEHHPIGLYVDDTGRLAGTMRVSEMLRERGEFQIDEWVMGESWRKEPEIGVFVIIEKRFVGLIPASEPNALSRGESAKFRVSDVLADKKIVLSLRGKAHDEIATDAQKILARLQASPTLRVGDRSSPETIHNAFGMSKKAFKRAVGRLLKERIIDVDNEGFPVVLSKR